MPEAKAGYRFIPVNKHVVAPPLGFHEISHAKPRKEGYCGTIGVTWTAETPICVGAPEVINGNEVVLPFKLGDRYALPGSSIKGMIRSVLEIATYSHLGQINAHHHFGQRRFPNELPDDLKNKTIYAAWLIHEDSKWELYKSLSYNQALKGNKSLHLLPIKQIETLTGTNDWMLKPIEEKRKILNQPGRSELVWCDSADGDFGNTIAAELGFGEQEGHPKSFIICGGGVDAGMNKKNETIFFEPVSSSKQELSPETMKKFSMIHSRPGRNGPTPLGSWRYWLETTGWPEPNSGRPLDTTIAPGLGDLPGIPVFYCGSVNHANEAFGKQFFMSLSRVPKVAYAHSVGDVAIRTTGQEDSPYHAPSLQENIDFARAIFGDVEAALDESGKKADKSEERAALKGRVAFGFALGPQVEAPLNIQTTVLMGPKASFWPFYLKKSDDTSQTASYDDHNVILAGRKRYPLRPLTSLPQNPTDNPEVETRISFLPAGSEFKGQIRFHNLHPVELGALLWALTFGKPGDKYRHGMGRAKAFGYGILKCDASLSARPNLGGEAVTDSQEFMDKFANYMEEQMSGTGYSHRWESSPAVAALLKMADPLEGERLKSKLAYMALTHHEYMKDNETPLPSDYVKKDDYKAMSK